MTPPAGGATFVAKTGTASGAPPTRHYVSQVGERLS